SAWCASRRARAVWAPRAARRSAPSRAAMWAAAAGRSPARSAARSSAASWARASSARPTSVRASSSRCCSIRASTSPLSRKRTRNSAPATACASSPGGVASRGSRISRRAPGPVRALRWTRIAGHAGGALFLLRWVYPRLECARRRALMRWWSAKLLAILNVRADVEGEADGAVMIAANHVSWLDIFVISSIRPTRFIAKDEVRVWPVTGWIGARAGTLFIRRDQWRDTARINARVRSVLEEGDCVGLFPEGLTTEGDRLLKFHSSLFESAVANRARVHATAIRYERADGSLCREMSFIGERTFMQSLTLIIAQRSVCARVAFLPPIATDGSTRRTVAS